jgi:hypothetical protein
MALLRLALEQVRQAQSARLSRGAGRQPAAVSAPSGLLCIEGDRLRALPFSDLTAPVVCDTGAPGLVGGPGGRGPHMPA